MKRIHVVAGVIRKENKLLIAKRPDDKHQGGKWEFAGGKVEPDELPLHALKRELAEELSIEVQHAMPLIRIQHDYPDKSILLDVWEVVEFTGTACGNEGQIVKWVPEDTLTDYEFPAANKPIVMACIVGAVFDDWKNAQIQHGKTIAEFIAQPTTVIDDIAQLQSNSDWIVARCNEASVLQQLPHALIDLAVYPVFERNWKAFEKAVAGLPIPVFALSAEKNTPLDEEDLLIARTHGAVGITQVF